MNEENRYSVDNKMVRFTLLTTEQNHWLDMHISRYDRVLWISSTAENLEIFDRINRYFDVLVKHNYEKPAFSFRRSDEIDLEAEVTAIMSEEIQKEIDEMVLKEILKSFKL